MLCFKSFLFRIIFNLFTIIFVHLFFIKFYKNKKKCFFKSLHKSSKDKVWVPLKISKIKYKGKILP